MLLDSAGTLSSFHKKRHFVFRPTPSISTSACPSVASPGLGIVPTGIIPPTGKALETYLPQIDEVGSENAHAERRSRMGDDDAQTNVLRARSTARSVAKRSMFNTVPESEDALAEKQTSADTEQVCRP